MRPLIAARAPLPAALLWLLAGCAGQERPDLQPGQAPETDSVEAGLWMVMERAEDRLRTSGRVIPDPELQAYVQDIACAMANDHCLGLRTYVVRQPGFNATMAPNGFMSVWSGLILRCENEAQLATVIGHEIAHYLRRHSLQRWETARDTMSAAVVFGVVSAGIGVPLGGFAQLGAYGYIQSYTRDQEREADSLGFALMSGHGYDPQAEPQIWRNLIAEREAAEEDSPDPFFSSHPPSEERMAKLSELAEAGQAAAHTQSGRFHAIVRRHRAGWLEDELDLGHYAEMQVVLERLKNDGHTPGVVWYYLGEVLRRQPEVEEKSEALAAFRRALDYDDAPAVTYRSLGLLLSREGDLAGAREAYRNYLAAAPEAEDLQMIRHYVNELEKKL